MLAVVTGANGFIGQHLTSALADSGWTVRPLVRSHPERSEASAVRNAGKGSAVPPASPLIPINYSDPVALARALDKADVVFHAAGATRAPTSRQLFRANVDLTRAVLAACVLAHPGRFLFISSQAAAGPARSRDKPVTEDDIPAPIESYGRSKRAAELAVAEEGKRVPFTIVRPSAVYGPGDRDFLQLFRAASRGLAIHTVNRRNWISVIHVRDLVAGVIAAAASRIAIGKRYFLCNDEPVTWANLFELAAQGAGKTVTFDLAIPAPIVDVAAAAGDLAARLTGHASLLTSDKIALGRPPFWICSNDKARAEIGFVPAVDLSPGISETYEWYRRQRWL